MNVSRCFYIWLVLFARMQRAHYGAAQVWIWGSNLMMGSLVDHIIRSTLTWQEDLEAGEEMIKRRLKWHGRPLSWEKFMVGELLSNQAGRTGWTWRRSALDFKKCYISSDSNWKVRRRQGVNVDVHFVPICVVFLHVRVLGIWYSLESMCLLHISANTKHCLSFEALAWMGHKDATSVRRWQSKIRKAERSKNQAEDSTPSCFGRSLTL